MSDTLYFNTFLRQSQVYVGNFTDVVYAATLNTELETMTFLNDIHEKKNDNHTLSKIIFLKIFMKKCKNTSQSRKTKTRNLEER